MKGLGAFNLFFSWFFQSFFWRRTCKLRLFIICLRLKGNISTHVRYWYLSIFLDDNVNTFAASLLIWYCSFSSLILYWFVMVSFYILFKRFFLKRQRLSASRVASITKKEYGFAVHILQRFINCLKSISNE